jgi:hypothetical protein
MEWERIKEGELFTGDSLATRLAYAQTRINDLPSISVERASLSREHIPSVVIATAYASIDPGTSHTYNSIQDLYPGWNTPVGWTVINTDGSVGSGAKLQADFASDMDTSNPSLRVLVLANVNITEIEELITPVMSAGFVAVFALQVQRSGFTSWEHIARSERFVNSEFWVDYSSGGTEYQLKMWKDVPIRCLILPSDGFGEIRKVRMVVSVVNTRATYATELVQVSLKQGNLSAIAFQTGVL